MGCSPTPRRAAAPPQPDSGPRCEPRDDPESSRSPPSSVDPGSSAGRSGGGVTPPGTGPEGLADGPTGALEEGPKLLVVVDLPTPHAQEVFPPQRGEPAHHPAEHQGEQHHENRPRLGALLRAPCPGDDGSPRCA